MKPGKYQRSKRRCQDLCWKVLDWAQSSVFCLYTMQEFLNKSNHLKFAQYGVNSYCVLCPVKVHNEGRSKKQSGDERGLVGRPRFPDYRSHWPRAWNGLQYNNATTWKQRWPRRFTHSEKGNVFIDFFYEYTWYFQSDEIRNAHAYFNC